MRHKIKTEYEDGVKYRVDNPECTCRRCLLNKLQKSEKALHKANIELDELIERPNSPKSKSIRFIYKSIKIFKKDLSNCFWFGSVNNSDNRGIFNMFDSKNPRYEK